MPDNPQHTLKAVAADAIERAGGDAIKATELMVARIRSSNELRIALTDPLLDTACYNVIKSIFHQERKVLWVTTSYHSRDNMAGVENLANAMSRVLLDWPLPIAGCPKLRNATRKMLDEAIEYYACRVKPYQQREAWLRMVRNNTQATGTVEDYVTEEQLIAFRNKAEEMYK